MGWLIMRIIRAIEGRKECIREWEIDIWILGMDHRCTMEQGMGRSICTTESICSRGEVPVDWTVCLLEYMWWGWMVDQSMVLCLNEIVLKWGVVLLLLFLIFRLFCNVLDYQSFHCGIIQYWFCLKNAGHSFWHSCSCQFDKSLFERFAVCHWYFTIRIPFIPTHTLLIFVFPYHHTQYRVSFSLSVIHSTLLIGVSSIKIFVLSPKLWIFVHNCFLFSMIGTNGINGFTKISGFKISTSTISIRSIRFVSDNSSIRYCKSNGDSVKEYRIRLCEPCTITIEVLVPYESLSEAA